MPLNKASIAELRRELKVLRQQREKLDERIKVLRRLLLLENGWHPRAGGVRSAAVKISAARKPVPGQMVKAVVLRVLKEHPGTKAAVLAKVLRDQGFQTQRPNRLAHRVYNKLWRLAQRGEIIKTPDGRFYPKEGSA